jgi:hypothetical protein
MNVEGTGGAEMTRNRLMVAFLVAGLMTVAAGTVPAGEPDPDIRVKRGAGRMIIRGTTRHWREADKTPLDQRSGPRKFRQNNELEEERPIVVRTGETDPVVQRNQGLKSWGRKDLTDPLGSFAGMNLSANGGGWPPDTTGDVGLEYYVQAVNTSLAVFQKSDGALVSATTFDDFFGGTGITGTPCDDENNGDPIVLFDPYDERWFVLDFAWDSSETDGSYYSVAVSKTSDPTGEWWQYAMRADDEWLNDYPKAGIWPDGIYITANMYPFDGGFQGVKIWALKKPDIYNGTLDVQWVFDDSPEAFSILPSNARGGTPPPAGAPNYMFSFDANEWGGVPTDRLYMWSYAVDWDNAANTTWTGPVYAETAPFVLSSSGVPQQGSAWPLDSIAGRLMYPANYRNFGTHESVYLCHTVSVDGLQSTRWYETRVDAGSLAIHQQGTFAPDTHHRWMGSVAADRHGAVAIGYSVSSSDMYPSIRYAGRLTLDPLNELTRGERSGVEGTGSQSSFFLTRWGDYSTMSIDPVDDETFWYTQEYYITTGTNWQTRIISFRLDPVGSGDLDGNTLLEIADVQLLSDYLSGNIDTLPVSLAEADCNGDIMVDATDLAVLLNWVNAK